ncbi:MAG TPA: gamma-glutamylcyclotransferase family protein, partial [Solirubrobacteraceae bacterium]|nr:gamma-glutamylcyclotransferase family protein [Solirubrobacteraceae bacterium]
IPGYKVYLREDGSRPAVFVAFLDLLAQEGATTDGLLLEVDDEALRAVDERERNYERVDVSGAVDGARGATVWAYRGTSAGRERLRCGLAKRRAVVARSYLETVRAGFAAAGIRDGADPGELPVMDLERVDLPA